MSNRIAGVWEIASAFKHRKLHTQIMSGWNWMLSPPWTFWIYINCAYVQNLLSLKMLKKIKRRQEFPQTSLNPKAFPTYLKRICFKVYKLYLNYKTNAELQVKSVVALACERPQVPHQYSKPNQVSVVISALAFMVWEMKHSVIRHLNFLFHTQENWSPKS